MASKVIEKLLRCGDPRYGLTLLHCPDCKIHMGVPFSCKTRVCPSCVNRRAEVLSHTLAVKLPDETPFVSRRIAPAWREF